MLELLPLNTLLISYIVFSICLSLTTIGQTIVTAQTHSSLEPCHDGGRRSGRGVISFYV